MCKKCLGGGEVEDISRRLSIPVSEVEQIMTLMHLQEQPRTRGKAESASKAPPGGISICEASRKYKISDRTICEWVKRAYIPVLLNTCWAKFIDEAKLAEVVEIYRQRPGRGSRIVEQTLGRPARPGLARAG